MLKDFDQWNKKKKGIDSIIQPTSFHERELEPISTKSDSRPFGAGSPFIG
jgi:hypothetical protein